MRFSKFFTAAALTACLMSTGVQADTITDGFTYTVADYLDGVGDHFHSNTSGDFGNPDGKAAVGEFLDEEEIRGLSEYDLAGLNAATTAFVSFNVVSEGGLFEDENDFPFTGDIDIFAYQGNNAEDVSDFEIATVASVGTFNTGGLMAGDVLSFEITDIFNDAINNGRSSLGIRLQTASGVDPMGGAYTFDTFRLTTDDQTAVTVIPEPTTAGIALLALGAVTALGRGRRGAA